MSDPGSISFESKRQRGSESRILEPDAKPSRPGGETDTSRICDACHWSVLTTRRFRGRMVCLACIAEHFQGEDEES